MFSFDEFIGLADNPELRDPVIRQLLLEAQLDEKKREGLRSLLYD